MDVKKGGVEEGSKIHLQRPPFSLGLFFDLFNQGISFQEHSNQHLHFLILMKSCKFEE